jgi:hypothetical protein
LSRPAAAIDVELPGERRMELHGFYELRLRFVGDDMPKNGVTFSQFSHAIALETDIEIFPDGFGPFDFMSAFTRWVATYECIYQRGCGLFSSADSYGGDARSVKRLPRNIRKGAHTDDAYTAGLFHTGRRPGSLRSTREHIQPGMRPRDYLQLPGIGTHANLVTVLGNLQSRGVLGGPIEPQTLQRVVTRAGSYNTRSSTRSSSRFCSERSLSTPTTTGRS